MESATTTMPDEDGQSGAESESESESEREERNPYRNGESGRYTTEYSVEGVVEALRELDGEGTTSEVAEAMGCARRTAYNYLHDAEEQGRVTGREVAAAKLWRLDESESPEESR